MCLVHKAGSLSVIEYGSNEVLAVCRTEHMSPYLLSAADVEARGTSAAVKRVVYLLDLQTIRVVDLLDKGQSLATISHDSKIDWLVRAPGGLIWAWAILSCVKACSRWRQVESPALVSAVLGEQGML
jgi:hypothetical protein